jgi:uncharacterized membrane protein YedE/YeeE
MLMSYSFGVIFGLGLLISGMCRVSKIRGFLILDMNVWDPTLMFVMMSAVIFNFFTFRKILAMDKPVYGEKFGVPNPNAKIDARLIVGAAIFGMGWGLSALCPGPGVVNMFCLTHAIFWVFGLVVG